MNSPSGSRKPSETNSIDNCAHVWWIDLTDRLLCVLCYGRAEDEIGTRVSLGVRTKGRGGKPAARLHSKAMETWSRRAKKQGFTHRELQLMILYGTNCYYCKRDFDTKTRQTRPTLEHRIPKSKGGGGRSLTVACYQCNHAKGDMTEREFKRYRELLRQSPNKKSALLALRREIEDEEQKSDE